MFNWKDKNAFVTGGNGFVGSWLVNELVNKEANVTCIVRDPVKGSNLEFLGIADQVNTVKGNIGLAIK